MRPARITIIAATTVVAAIAGRAAFTPREAAPAAPRVLSAERAALVRPDATTPGFLEYAPRAAAIERGDRERRERGPHRDDWSDHDED